MTNKPKGLFALEPPFFDLVYGGENLRRLQRLVDISIICLSREQILARPEVLRDVELLFSSWGAPSFDLTFLQAAPRLRAVFHAAGTVKPLLTDDFWNREVTLANAASANAIPVAEFTLAQIILSLKRTWWHIRQVERTFTYPDRNSYVAYAPGAYGSVVGIVSLGRIGSLVREKLRILDVKVIVYDPFLYSVDRARRLGVESVSLEELFCRSDVVTLHTPWLAETDGLISGRHLASMKRNATFINTARGRIVREKEMIEVLSNTPRFVRSSRCRFGRAAASQFPALSLTQCHPDSAHRRKSARRMPAPGAFHGGGNRALSLRREFALAGDSRAHGE